LAIFLAWVIAQTFPQREVRIIGGEMPGLDLPIIIKKPIYTIIHHYVNNLTFIILCF
jgi:hypothetical protein